MCIYESTIKNQIAVGGRRLEWGEIRLLYKTPPEPTLKTHAWIKYQFGDVDRLLLLVYVSGFF